MTDDRLYFKQLLAGRDVGRAIAADDDRAIDVARRALATIIAVLACHWVGGRIAANRGRAVEIADRALAAVVADLARGHVDAGVAA